MDKTIVITGGGQGLGKAIATRLAPHEQVIILDHKEDIVKPTAEKLNCQYKVCDITQPEIIKTTVGEIIADKGKIDVLVNNAGIWIQGLLEEGNDERIQEVFAVNCVGAILMTKYVLPHMKEKNSGTVIDIVSQAGITAKSERSIYNCSKWAMTGFTKCLQEELSGTNIRIIGIYPGLMKTNLFKNAGAERDDLEKALNPDELAKTIEFILTLDDTTSFPELGIKNIKY